MMAIFKMPSRVACSPQPTVTIGDGLVRQLRSICRRQVRVSLLETDRLQRRRALGTFALASSKFAARVVLAGIGRDPPSGPGTGYPVVTPISYDRTDEDGASLRPRL